MAETSAPPVVAVVVAHDPGPWFDEVLDGLAAQDYPALAVLAIDNASEADDVAERVRARLPAAVVRSTTEDRGYAVAANQVRDLVEGAAFYLFCHDDVVLAPDAVTALVTEAIRSNAGVVGPKLVMWDAPDRIVSIGSAVDRTGVLVPLVEHGELDQEQHDRVRDVFVVEGAAVLVRADLFDALEGFDEEITFLGEDVDLCWRAHVAGARVLIVPAAVARHLEALGARRPHDDRRRLRGRHRMRSLLGITGPFRLVWLVPVAAVMSLLEMIYALALLRGSHAKDLAGAWTWNLARPVSLRRKRRAVRRLRKVRDGDIGHLQVSETSRLTAYLQGQMQGGGRLHGIGDAGRALAASVRRGPKRGPAIAWSTIVLLALFGSRHIITRGLPVHGEMMAMPRGVRVFLDPFLDGWLASGLGTDKVIPSAGGVLGALAAVSLGHPEGLRVLLVLGLLPVGWLSAWFLGRPLGSRPGRVALLVVYAALPIPFEALGIGHWTALLCWALAPAILLRLGRCARIEPFVEDGREPRPWWREGTALGLLLAVGAAFAPVVVPGAVLMALGIAVGGLVVAKVDGIGRLLAGTALGVVVAALLHGPWVLGLLGADVPVSQLLGRHLPSTADGLGAMLRFDTGTHSHDILGWGFLVAAAVPLVVGRDWRYTWAVRAWVGALAGFGLAWVSARGWGEVPLPDPVVALTLAGPFVALAAGLGVTAFHRDLPSYRFGPAQAVVLVGGAALALATLPVLGGVADGHWDMPDTDLSAAFPFLSDDEPGGSRILWVGDEEVLPAPGWAFSDATSFTTSDDGPPDLRLVFPAPLGAPVDPIAAALDAAVDGGSARLGALLAPSGIRYIVAVEQAAPSFTDTPIRPVETSVSDALDRQLDLRRVPTDSAVRVWANEAFVPIEAELDTRTVEAIANDDARPTDGLGVVEPLDGSVADRTTVHLARASTRWEVTVDGDRLDGERLLPAGYQFPVTSGGEAAVHFAVPPARRLLVLAQVLLWLVAWRIAVVARRDRDEVELPERPKVSSSAATRRETVSA